MSLLWKPPAVLTILAVWPELLIYLFCVPKYSAAVPEKAKKKQALEKKEPQPVRHVHWNEADAPACPIAFGQWIDQMVEEIEGAHDVVVNCSDEATTSKGNEPDARKYSPPISWLQQMWKSLVNQVMQVNIHVTERKKRLVEQLRFACLKEYLVDTSSCSSGSMWLWLKIKWQQWSCHWQLFWINCFLSGMPGCMVPPDFHLKQAPMGQAQQFLQSWGCHAIDAMVNECEQWCNHSAQTKLNETPLFSRAKLRWGEKYVK